MSVCRVFPVYRESETRSYPAADHGLHDFFTRQLRSAVDILAKFRQAELHTVLPLIQQDVLSQGWMDLEQLVNFIAVSESTPGPLAVNLSTYIGAETGGLLGSFCATVGVVLPSFVIILLVAKFYQAFQTNTLVKGCMNGLRPTVVGMIGASLLSVGASAFPAAGGVMQWVLAAVLLAAILAAHWKKVHPILLIVGSAVVGIAAGYAGLLPGV